MYGTCICLNFVDSWDYFVAIYAKQGDAFYPLTTLLLAAPFYRPGLVWLLCKQGEHVVAALCTFGLKLSNNKVGHKGK